jgi:hypothetical protein
MFEYIMDKRHFTVVEKGGKEHGLYVSSTPSSAAKKAVSKLCASNKSKKVEFYLREITQGSKKKTYGPYLGEMKKLKTPIELKGRIIQYKPVAKLSDKKNNVKKEGMIGGGGGPSKLFQSTEEPVSAYIFVNSPRGNRAERPAPNNVSGSAAVEINNSEQLPKITDNLTVEEFNTIVCAMIDHLFDEGLIAMPPPHIDDQSEWKSKGFIEPTIEYFLGKYPDNDLKETMKTIIKKNLKMKGIDINLYFESDYYLQQVNEAIDTIPIDRNKWMISDRDITEEREKIKMIIHHIILVISAIYETTYNKRDKFMKLTNKLTTPDSHGIYSDIYVKLIEKYYNILGSLY